MEVLVVLVCCFGCAREAILKGGLGFVLRRSLGWLRGSRGEIFFCFFKGGLLGCCSSLGHFKGIFFEGCVYLVESCEILSAAEVLWLCLGFKNARKPFKSTAGYDQTIITAAG